MNTKTIVIRVEVVGPDDTGKVLEAPWGKKTGRPVTEGARAERWILDYLKDGPKPSGNKNVSEPGGLYGDAIAAGFSRATLQRAAGKLGVQRWLEVTPNRWMWALPGDTTLGKRKAAVENVA